MPQGSGRHRLRYKALETTRHQHRCCACGAEPIITLDEEHNPVLACRYHPEAGVEERT